MKNRLMQLAAGLALMAVLGKFYAVPLVAQVRAAVVKNIDERGRIPYMVQINCQSLGEVNSCDAQFPAVPANRRFVIEYINGRIFAAPNSQFANVYLELPSGGPIYPGLSTHFESTTFGLDRYSVSMPVVLYCEAGQIAAVHIESNVLANSIPSASLTLSGYLVDLTQ